MDTLLFQSPSQQLLSTNYVTRTSFKQEGSGQGIPRLRVGRGGEKFIGLTRSRNIAYGRMLIYFAILIISNKAEERNKSFPGISRDPLTHEKSKDPP